MATTQTCKHMSEYLGHSRSPPLLQDFCANRVLHRVLCPNFLSSCSVLRQPMSSQFLKEQPEDSLGGAQGFTHVVTLNHLNTHHNNLCVCVFCDSNKQQICNRKVSWVTSWGGEHHFVSSVFGKVFWANATCVPGYALSSHNFLRLARKCAKSFCNVESSRCASVWEVIYNIGSSRPAHTRRSSRGASPRSVFLAT